MSEAGGLRQRMPETARFIDALREAFGAAGIDASIRAGIRGEPNRFHASENGLEVGVAFTGTLVEPIMQGVPRAK